MHIAVVFTEKRLFALLPPSKRPFLISGTAGNFFAHTLPPSQVFRAFVYICIYYIYISDTVLHYIITVYVYKIQAAARRTAKRYYQKRIL